MSRVEEISEAVKIFYHDSDPRRVRAVAYHGGEFSVHNTGKWRAPALEMLAQLAVGLSVPDIVRQFGMPLCTAEGRQGRLREAHRVPSIPAVVGRAFQNEPRGTGLLLIDKMIPYPIDGAPLLTARDVQILFLKAQGAKDQAVDRILFNSAKSATTHQLERIRQEKLRIGGTTAGAITYAHLTGHLPQARELLFPTESSACPAENIDRSPQSSVTQSQPPVPVRQPAEAISQLAV